jgi:SAM-dependent methyltransferase
MMGDVDRTVHDYLVALEKRLDERSNLLEDIHLEAAIDAKVVDEDADNAQGDNCNSNAVENCWSPYVPSQAARIAEFLSFAELNASDVLLDIGCGDGRVCVAAAALLSCRSIGMDVSPPCIAMAKQIAQEEGLSPFQCSFYQADMSADPDALLHGEQQAASSPMYRAVLSRSAHSCFLESSPLSSDLLSVTVVYLYTFPTLLNRLISLLSSMFSRGKLRAVVTLTYHLEGDDGRFVVAKLSHQLDLRSYSQIQV